jgi:hypothetical protein
MLAQYPYWVREFINAAGGLSKRELWLGYQIASKHMRTCGKPGGKRVQTALPMPVGPKLVPTRRRKPREFRVIESVGALQLQEMNARELRLHRQRVDAWALQDRRAKKLAAQRVIEDAQAKIEKLLRANSADSPELQEELSGAAGESSLLQRFQQLIRTPPQPKQVKDRQNFNLQ